MDCDNLKEKIKEDLEKTGFLSEMRALATFRRRDWIATGSTSFFDLDEEISRESDIQAYISSNEMEGKKYLVHTFFQITAEVKKSERPWVVFKEIPHWEWFLGERWDSLVSTAGIPSERPEALTEALNGHSLSAQLGWLGNGIHEFKKNPDQPSRWYSSLVSVCKAAEGRLEANSRKDADQKKTFPYLFFVKPVIILDGSLIAASLNNNDVILEEINAATVQFYFLSKKYRRGRYKIDIVVLPYLDEYLQLCEKRHKEIFGALKKIVLKKGR